jgi:hypothetical protein
MARREIDAYGDRAARHCPGSAISGAAGDIILE